MWEEAELKQPIETSAAGEWGLRSGADGGRAMLAWGPVTAAAVAALWVALTAATGKTYHLAPPLIAAAPGALDWSRRAAAPVPSATVAAACGLGVTALGWLVIVVAHIEPEATLVAGQPGGVPGEVAVGALLGAAAGAWLLKRSTTRGVGPPGSRR